MNFPWKFVVLSSILNLAIVESKTMSSEAKTISPTTVKSDSTNPWEDLNAQSQHLADITETVHIGKEEWNGYNARLLAKAIELANVGNLQKTTLESIRTFRDFAPQTARFWCMKIYAESRISELEERAYITFEAAMGILLERIKKCLETSSEKKMISDTILPAIVAYDLPGFFIYMNKGFQDTKKNPSEFTDSQDNAEVIKYLKKYHNTFVETKSIAKALKKFTSAF